MPSVKIYRESGCDGSEGMMVGNWGKKEESRPLACWLASSQLNSNPFLPVTVGQEQD